MFLTDLEVVNACLATMGETPLNTLEDDHAYKAAALSALSNSSKIEQKAGWWFNSEYITLNPDAVSGYIYLPGDALAVKTITRGRPPFAQRGNRLYNKEQNNYVWDKGVAVDLVRLLPFSELPFHASDAVGYGAIIRFQTDFDGDMNRFGQLSVDYRRARAELRAEDTRNMRPNLLATRSNQIKMSFIGGPSQSHRLPYTPNYP